MRDLENDSRFFLHELDVVSDDSKKNCVANVIEKFGRIDILVNNAEVQCVGPLAELPWSAMEQTFNTNVLGAPRMIQAVVPHMAARKKGKIVNTGSISVAMPTPWAAVYGASKATILSLTDTLRLELRHFGIHVTVVAPGAIKSNIANSAVANCSTAEWNLYEPFEDIIKERAYLSQTPKSTPADVFARDTLAVLLKNNPPAWFTTGQFSTIMAIIYHMPNWFKDFVARRIMKG
ncbi:short-chain dehydrogenase RED1-like [Mangifera indica]|uniref:short-chain dehydrogenase RED1-like n=1 Tax=Mangifera indica TaxID=29780 RepID=UPI001CF9DBB9|nr:short-chain dehydrogenase RED1-like [Mangifera indica]